MPRPSFAVALAVGALALAAPRAAGACGVSGPDGASLCMLAQGIGPSFRVSLSGIYTSTRLSFSGGALQGDERRGGTVAALAYSLTRDLTVQGGLGASFGGAFDAPNGAHRFEPGLLGLVGASARLYGGPELDENGEGRERNPFVILTSVFSFNLTRTKHRDASGSDTTTGYEAFDLRVGGIVGVTVGERFRPYVLARVFGGPVFWRYEGSAVTGTDFYHVQLGGGLSVALGKGFAVFAEGVPLGERGASAGASLAL